MPDLEDAWDVFGATVQKGAGDLAKNLFSDWQEPAKQDAAEFIELARDKLPKWTRALAQGHLSKNEFSLLLRSLEGLAELNALKAKGIAKQKLEQFRMGLISIVVNAALATVGL
ncbi:hypothetical protein ROLI_016040 [Roseobacter fucihabitans]|uniref:Uncharacterized protein n=1 Tax=Roseobacter fucihabitans TaxID=1537242 RepID=A0ABZ2BS44_9RHOB|nr:hypothetical protein [Roseobacter litoralis]MBC6966653.1 hypothetical protein [Roseobacter litoralis]